MPEKDMHLLTGGNIIIIIAIVIIVILAVCYGLMRAESSRSIMLNVTLIIIILTVLIMYMK